MLKIWPKIFPILFIILCACRFLFAKDDVVTSQNLIKLRLKEYNLNKKLEKVSLAEVRQQQQWEYLLEKHQKTEGDYFSEQLLFMQAVQDEYAEKKTLLTVQIKYIEILREIISFQDSFEESQVDFKRITTWRIKVDSWMKRCKHDRHFYMARRKGFAADLKELSLQKGERLSLSFIDILGKNIHRVLEEHDQDYIVVIKDISDVLKIIGSVDEELKRIVQEIPFSKKILQHARKISNFWYIEVFRSKGHSLTVGKFLLVFIFLIFGVFLSKFLSRFLVVWLRKKTQIGLGTTVSVQKLSFYVFLVIFTLVSLKSIDVPLTMFAFLGGALALGLGFGSQNIVNNFISGLVLLIEQPVKTKDYVEVDGILGEVEYIGIRSTLVKTIDNIHLVIPNSTFLEKNVVNRTLSDQMIRTSVTVGVAYGSPTVRVRKLILEAVNQHKLILKNPCPIVLFENFGDNSLEFRVHFWVRLVQITDSYIIESDLRYIIDNLFRKQAIVIAFPQRDIHLDSGKPLEIKIVPEGRGLK